MSSINFVTPPRVIAHRGASRVAPENTLAAFQQAKALGANWVEFDVMLSADNEVVVIHDETLERTTNGKGFVSEHPYSYLKMLDAGSWFDPIFSDQRIPTLREVIALLNQFNLSANIEIKAQAGKEKLTVERVLDILKTDWRSETSDYLISSFSLAILEWARHCSEESLLGFLMDEWNDQWQKECDRLHCVTVNVNHFLLNPHRVEQIKETQRILLAYTVNDATRARELFSWGVNGIFSDVLFDFAAF